MPEINLTPQLEAQVRARFPAFDVVALHSGLAAGQRAAAWLAAHEGRAQVVVGTRLAVFASLPRLALIVVDEEHDPSYKAGEGVRYSARDLAVKRAQMLGMPVVLGSATPSIESWAHARSGRYRLLTLRQRAVDGDWIAPTIELVDPGASIDASGIAPADPARAGGDAAAGRAVAGVPQPSRLCAGRRLRSVRLAVELSALRGLRRVPQARPHAALPSLRLELSPCRAPARPAATAHCRASGAARSVSRSRCSSCCRPRACCASTATRRGAGTAATDAFDAVHRGDVDVLVGTQMIAKGHDFRNVALVVVLNADSQLASHDFRASERLFATLVQVIGRAGRSGRASRALLQTRFPQHPLFAALARHDYAAFADALLAERGRAGMPPATHQALLTAEARDDWTTAIAFLRDGGRAGGSAGSGARSTIRCRWRWCAAPESSARNCWSRPSQRGPLQTFLRAWLSDLRAQKSRVRWQIEVDPAEI